MNLPAVRPSGPVPSLPPSFRGPVLLPGGHSLVAAPSEALVRLVSGGVSPRIDHRVAAILAAGLAGCDGQGPIEERIWQLWSEVSAWGWAGAAVVLSAVGVYATLRRQGKLSFVGAYAGVPFFYLNKRLGWKLTDVITDMRRSPMRDQLEMPDSRRRDAELLCHAFYSGLGRIYFVTAPNGAGKSSFLAWFSDQIFSGEIPECNSRRTSVYRVALHRLPNLKDVKYFDKFMNDWKVFDKVVSLEIGRQRRVVLLVDGLDTALKGPQSDTLVQILQDLATWTEREGITIFGVTSTASYQTEIRESILGRYATERPLTPMTRDEVIVIARKYVTELNRLELALNIPKASVLRAVDLSLHEKIRNAVGNPGAVKRILDSAQRAARAGLTRGRPIGAISPEMIDEAVAREMNVPIEEVQTWALP